MPAVGSCSAGIAAACHAPRGGTAHERQAVMWGVVVVEEEEEEEELQSETTGDDGVADGAGSESGAVAPEVVVGHCAFSSAKAGALVPGRLYA